jgi:hypothetical protein
LKLQKLVGNILKHTGIGNDFLNRTPMGQQIRKMLNKWECIKVKSFCIAKETVTRFNRLPTEWEKIFAIQ